MDGRQAATSEPHRREATRLLLFQPQSYYFRVDWFAKLTGFVETGYEETRAKLEVDGEYLTSRVNGARYRVGRLELASLAELRDRVSPSHSNTRRLKARVILADVRELLAHPENAGALFQVASQFNLLEMVAPHITPEDGVTGYIEDLTQGPACAVAAGAGTIYRNYFVPVGDGVGQTKLRQLDGLADLGLALSTKLGAPQTSLWSMRNGYALASSEGLARIEKHLNEIDEEELDQLRLLLRIGVQHDLEITEPEGSQSIVSQVFCSALPVSYSAIPGHRWSGFARLVLEAAYEATLLAGVANMQRGVSNVVYLTLLGGGAFGNDFRWIGGAIRRALARCANYALDVRLVSYNLPNQEMMDIVSGYR